MDAREDDAGGLNRVLPFGEDGMHGGDRRQNLYPTMNMVDGWKFRCEMGLSAASPVR